MAKNLEIKARVPTLEKPRQIARRLATSYEGKFHQRDTYFNCPTGRLKMREMDDGAVQLIAYRRADAREPTTSEYQICLLPSAEPCKAALSLTLGVISVVSKHREIFLVDTVRVHLDEVEQLGTFVEFEDVLDEDVLPEGVSGDGVKLSKLIKEFKLQESQFIEVSYADLLNGVGAD